MKATGSKEPKRTQWYGFCVRAAFYLCLSAGILFMLFADPSQGHFQNVVNNTIHYENGTVTAVLSEKLNPSQLKSGQSLGVQQLQVRLRSGESIRLENYLTETHNILARPGLRVIICADTPEGVEPYYTLYNYDRSVATAGIVLFFMALMLLIGGRRGLDASLAILFSLLLLLRVSIPAVYNGASSVAVGLMTVLIATAVTIFLLHGFTVRGLLAVLVTLAGIGMSWLIFWAFAQLLHVSGFQSEDAESLLVVAQNTGLDLKNILYASAMIVSLGAVMDVAVSLLSALWEMRQTQPDLAMAKLLGSGMNIGRDLIGTMSTTLIFVFAGGALTSMLVLYSYGVQPNQLLSSDYIALELSQSLCSTMAVIFTVPLASFSAAAVFPRLKIPGGMPAASVKADKETPKLKNPSWGKRAHRYIH